MFKYESLLEEIRQVMGDKKVITVTEKKVKTKQQAKTIALPTFKISENWGKPGNEDREALSSFLRNIRGGTLQEKIASLETFVSDCKANCIAAKNVPEILGNLVFLDVLSSIVYDFNAATSGFLWESLLAALIEGEQIAAEGGINTPIEDLIDSDDKRLSLKLVKGKSPSVGGSVRGLYRALEEYGQITYIVVTKTNQPNTKLNFYKTIIDPGNVEDKIIKTGEDENRWRMTAEKYKTEELGTLSLGSPEDLKEVASQYVSRLGEGVTEIFNTLDALTKNINIYFSGAEGAIKAGGDAKDQAKLLKRKVDQEF